MARQGDDKLARTQQQADEVTGIMRNNIEQARDRDLKLQGIEVKAERLQDQANRFKTQAKDLHFKMMCANARNTAILVFLSLLVLMLILWAMGAFN